MKFQLILAQTVWLLLTERVVSYERLKLEFDLSDDQLHAVRNELILIKKIATDRDGRCICWAGAKLEDNTVGPDCRVARRGLTSGLSQNRA